MITTQKPVTIRQVVTIAASTDAVYRVLTDPNLHSIFTGAKATGKPKVGGKMTAHDGYISGKYIYLHNGRGYVQTWITNEWPEGAAASRLEISLDPVKGGTRLTMVHADVPASQAARYRDGWRSTYWKPLKKYFR